MIVKKGYLMKIFLTGWTKKKETATTTTTTTTTTINK